MKKFIIGFDGLHRTCKGTQISLLQERLGQISIPSVVVRGDGTRRGVPNVSLDLFDYPSEWWSNHWNYFQEKSTDEEELAKLNLKFQRLNREAWVYFLRGLQTKMNSLNSSGGCMIMDRSLPSRYLTMRSFKPEIPFNEAIKSFNPKNKRAVNPIFPDQTYILHGPQSLLFDRLEQTRSLEEDFEFKIAILTKYYNAFDQIVQELRGENRITVLDCGRSIEEGHEFLWEDVN